MDVNKLSKGAQDWILNLDYTAYYIMNFCNDCFDLLYPAYRPVTYQQIILRAVIANCFLAIPLTIRVLIN